MVSFLKMLTESQPGQINVKDGNGDLSESDNSSDDVFQNAAMATQPNKSEIEATRSRFVTLSELRIETDIGKATLFLDSMAKVIEMDTREIFLGHLHKFQSMHIETRRSIK